MGRKVTKKPTKIKSLFNAPSAKAPLSEKADFLEILALRESDHDVSMQDLIEITGRVDEDEADRAIPGTISDQAAEIEAAETLDEHKQRIRDLGPASDLYPYDVSEDLLAVRSKWGDFPTHFLYWFLLFATRLNMRDDRQHGGLDGALLFEQVCLEVAKKYVGGPVDNRVRGLLFGTARHNLQWADETENRDRFAENVNVLCKELGEGHEFRAKDLDLQLTAKDDKLDVVVWRNFTDGKCGKLIVFGQCKTGSNWRQEMPRLNPDAFCRRWWHNPPAVLPVRLFFVSDRITNAPFYHASEAGVILDRCRILEHALELSDKTVKACAKWTQAVIKDHKIK